MKLPDIPFVVLDTETTGFVPGANPVIEFASVRVEKATITDTYEQLIRIKQEIPAPVQVLTRIRPADLEGKPMMEDVRAEIERHIGDDALIVGQNVGFDIRMLRAEGIDLTDRPWIDTSMLASLVFPELASYSLGYVSVVLGLKHEPVHRALGDVRATLELLERCWERFLELPPDRADVLRSFLQRSTSGYRMLAEALPASKKKKDPSWLRMPEMTLPDTPPPPAGLAADILKKPDRGTVHLVEEPLDPTTLQAVLDATVRDPKTTHWIAVKNLPANVQRLRIPDGVRVLYPPFMLLEPSAAAALAAEKTLSADEATLATKIAWYAPRSDQDLPIHGDERAVWSGKLACTETSAAYRKQFDDLPSVVLLDHRQLLAFLAEPDHAGYDVLHRPSSHVIIDDASMLEDTGTKAYGWSCALDDVRAGSQGNPALAKFTDLLQIWIEKVRQFQDVRYLAPSDLHTPEAGGLREQLDAILKKEVIPDPVRRQLLAFQKILNEENLLHRITWVEQRQNGSQHLASVPEHIGIVLQEALYKTLPVTLLIPPGSIGSLAEVLPPGTTMQLVKEKPTISSVAIDTPEGVTTATILENPPEGKTVILLGSRGSIEDLFVKYTEPLEKKNVTLICQSLSGGQGRMQAEFIAAKPPCVWLLTPWTFEGIELPPESIDRLVIQSLPFDHPSNPVFGRRAEHYRDAFADYSLPRLKHRLFRLLRTFCRYRSASGGVQVTDDRLRTKRYGKEVLEYLDQFSAGEEEGGDTKKQMPLFNEQ